MVGPRNKIVYNNVNDMWNNGYISVYVKGTLVESIYVDDYIDKHKNDDGNIGSESDPTIDAYDIIEILKKKYSISRVIVNAPNWK